MIRGALESEKLYKRVGTLCGVIDYTVAVHGMAWEDSVGSKEAIGSREEGDAREGKEKKGKLGQAEPSRAKARHVGTASYQAKADVLLMSGRCQSWLHTPLR